MKSKVVILTPLLLLIVISIWWFQSSSRWERVTVQLDSESSLIISRKPSHPYLAEYLREVTLVKVSKQFRTLSYPKDTGGGFPMQIRLYADQTNRLVRITDALYDRLIDLQLGEFVADQNPPAGKENASFISESSLPTLKHSLEVGRGFDVSTK